MTIRLSIGARTAGWDLEVGRRASDSVAEGGAGQLQRKLPPGDGVREEVASQRSRDMRQEA